MLHKKLISLLHVKVKFISMISSLKPFSECIYSKLYYISQSLQSYFVSGKIVQFRCQHKAIFSLSFCECYLFIHCCVPPTSAGCASAYWYKHAIGSERCLRIYSSPHSPLLPLLLFDIFILNSIVVCHFAATTRLRLSLSHSHKQRNLRIGKHISLSTLYAQHDGWQCMPNDVTQAF